MVPDDVGVSGGTSIRKQEIPDRHDIVSLAHWLFTVSMAGW